MANSTSGKKVTVRSMINFLAYVAIIFIGLSLMISRLFSGNLGSVGAALEIIAQILSYVLVGYFSFLYVKGKNNWVHYLVWSLAVVLVIVSFVL